MTTENVVSVVPFVGHDNGEAVFSRRGRFAVRGLRFRADPRTGGNGGGSGGDSGSKDDKKEVRFRTQEELDAERRQTRQKMKDLEDKGLHHNWDSGADDE